MEKCEHDYKEEIVAAVGNMGRFKKKCRRCGFIRMVSRLIVNTDDTSKLSPCIFNKKGIIENTKEKSNCKKTEKKCMAFRIEMLEIINIISKGSDYAKRISEVRDVDATSTIKQLRELKSRGYISSKKRKFLNMTCYKLTSRGAKLNSYYYNLLELKRIYKKYLY